MTDYKEVEQLTLEEDQWLNEHNDKVNKYIRIPLAVQTLDSIVQGLHLQTLEYKRLIKLGKSQQKDQNKNRIRLEEITILRDKYTREVDVMSQTYFGMNYTQFINSVSAHLATLKEQEKENDNT